MVFFRLFKPKLALPPPRLRLVVFGTKETLPWPLQLVHPGGLWGALLGFPTALRRHQDPRQLLERPMEPGDYLFEGLPGTVVACVQQRHPGVPYPGREPGHEEVRFLGTGVVERLRLEDARWVVALQLTEVLAEVKDAVLYQVELADRLAALSAGVVLDQEARRYYLPGKWRVANGLKPLDAREHVMLHLESVGGGTIRVHTHGLSKFGRPELEVLDLPERLGEDACRLMVDLSQQVIAGTLLRPGDRVGDPKVPLVLRLRRDGSGGHGSGPSLELVDGGREGESTEPGAARGIAAYSAAWSGRRAV